MRVSAALAALPLVILLASCGDSERDEDPEGGGGHGDAGFVMAQTTVEVGYTDSSVPPEHHRSWTLSADADEIRVSVNSYGDVVAEKRAPMPADTWEDLADAFEEIADIDEVDDEEGCAGGTAITVDIESPQRDAETSISACGETGLQESDTILRLIEPLTDLVDLAKLTDGRLPKT